MVINSTFIKDLYVIKYGKFEYLRGELVKFYNYDKLAEINLFPIFKETWFTRSNKNVIRAMHMQVGEKACVKLVTAINGSVKDVILDTRQNSETFGKYFEITLDAQQPTALYIPIGCAHEYKVMKKNSIVLYMASEVHSAKDDVGYRWDSFGYNWEVINPIMSERDKKLPLFREN